mmetsp:Transcript_27638/g.67220  ORF Transcript_27638/g.67220 Transcript_27638/m.67220 type:complete len:127 (+) Transcript_27638:1585-1965(+)
MARVKELQRRKDKSSMRMGKDPRNSQRGMDQSNSQTQRGMDTTDRGLKGMDTSEKFRSSVTPAANKSKSNIPLDLQLEMARLDERKNLSVPRVGSGLSPRYGSNQTLGASTPISLSMTNGTSDIKS